MSTLVPPLPWWPPEAPRTEHRAGNLRISSGRLVACDPFVVERPPVAFARELKRGVYDVRVGRSDGDLAYAALVISDHPVVSWEHARREGEPIHPATRRAPGFDVDATTGAYLDRDSLAILMRGHPSAVDLFERARAAGYAERPWATLSLGAGFELAVFGTGGDGRYASYWGLDAQGEPSVLVTDFGVLRREMPSDAESGPRDGSPGQDDRPLAVVLPFRPRRR